jgi:hypothetical protein
MRCLETLQNIPQFSQREELTEESAFSYRTARSGELVIANNGDFVIAETNSKVVAKAGSRVFALRGAKVAVLSNGARVQAVRESDVIRLEAINTQTDKACSNNTPPETINRQSTCSTSMQTHMWLTKFACVAAAQTDRSDKGYGVDRFFPKMVQLRQYPESVSGAPTPSNFLASRVVDPIYKVLRMVRSPYMEVNR